MFSGAAWRVPGTLDVADSMRWDTQGRRARAINGQDWDKGIKSDDERREAT